MLPGGPTLGPGGPALPDADRRQLERLREIVLDVLGPEVVGAYLFGSAVVGGLKPASDLDLLAVVRRPVTLEEKRRLVERLLAISWRQVPEGRWRRVELTLVMESEIRPWRYPPLMDFQYGDWLRDAFASGDPEPWQPVANPDLALLLTMALLADSPVLGPPPGEVLDPVPRADLLAVMAGEVDDMVADIHGDTRNAVLTLARIWSTVATGVIQAKDAAADWALERLPEEHRAVLARARAVYLGHEEERWDDLRPGLRPYAEHVAAETRRLDATGGRL